MSSGLHGSGSERVVNWREELHRAEHSIAIAQTRKLLNEYDSLPSSARDLALLKALQFQRQMMDEYAEVFNRLMLQGESKEVRVPPRPRKQRERVKLKPLSRAAGSTSSV